MVKKNFLKSSLIIALAVITALTVAAMLPNKVSAASNDSETVSLTYSAHMQTYGDGSIVEAGNEENETPTSFAGVIGESKRMESLAISFEGPEGVTLKYQAHVQGIGWQDVVTATKDNTTFIGTKGQSKRVEAIKITVEGLETLNKAGYAIKYRAHVQGIGWQDWITADDKAFDLEKVNFAGTTGESKRIEAIEVVLVHVHQYTYSYKGIADGVAQHIRKCTLCNEIETLPCEYGEWESSNDENVTRTCLCGHKETKKLQAVLKDATVTEVEVAKVAGSSALTVPVNKTLIVDEELSTTGDVTVNGTLILKGTTESNTKLKGKGTVIWAPELEEEKNFKDHFANADFLKLSSGKLANNAQDAKNLKFEIIVPELSKAQTITDQDNSALTLGEDWNVTIDLGKNILQNSATNTSGILLDNKGTLTIKNGTLKNTTPEAPDKDKYAIKNEETGKLTLENVNINTTSRGIASKGQLSMKDCTIEGNNKSDCVGMVVGYTSATEFGQAAPDMQKLPTVLDNVTMNKVESGIYVHATNAAVTLNNVNITATKFALHTNAKSPASNNSFAVTGGTFTSKGTVAYLAATGTHTFTNCTLNGANGVETTGSKLDLEGVTINATGKTIDGTVRSGFSTDLGSAVILKACTGYGDKNGVNLTVKNSKLTSANGYAVNVAAGAQLNNAVTKINISYDNASYEASNGKLGVQTVSQSLEKMTHTTYGAEE